MVRTPAKSPFLLDLLLRNRPPIGDSNPIPQSRSDDQNDERGEEQAVPSRVRGDIE